MRLLLVLMLVGCATPQYVQHWTVYETCSAQCAKFLKLPESEVAATRDGFGNCSCEKGLWKPSGKDE